MQINDAVLQSEEKIIFRLREIYLKHGYVPYRMSKFEEYDLYAKNKDFLISDNVITFTDTNGKLMALKPDVTLSIIKNSSDRPDEINRVFYNENVYRVSKGSNSYKEIMQSGIECFGDLKENDILNTIKLAKASLSVISDDHVLTVSDIDITEYLVSSLDLSSSDKKQMYKAIGEKNIPQIDNLTKYLSDRSNADIIKKLLSADGYLCEVRDSIKEIISQIPSDISSPFINLIDRLSQDADSADLKIDFSLLDDLNYYNSIILKGYIRNIPSAVLSGGQYDKLMKKLRKRSKAIGFAIYTDLLERMDEKSDDDSYINVALPKGRLGEKVYSYFEKAGYPCPSIRETNRKLVFENDEKKIRYFWVKPSDVAIYVERGAADIGVAGKDILLEYEPDVYELLDLRLGKCRMAVAGPKEFKDDKSKTLVVATKFSNIAGKYYRSLGRDIDIIHLNGSIEIAPILKLSDVIVDIVETGKTLKENDLEVKEEILPISARLISNKTSQKFKAGQIRKIAKDLSALLEDQND